MVAVEENTCTLEVSPAALRAKGILVVRSYMEALGLLAAHKAGVHAACLTPNLPSIRELGLDEPALHKEMDHGPRDHEQSRREHSSVS